MANPYTRSTRPGPLHPNVPAGITRLWGTDVDPAGRGVSNLSPARLALRLKTLKKRNRDQQYRSTQILNTRAGRVFIYTFQGKEARVIHMISIIPAGGHGYVLDAIHKPGAVGVSRQIIAIVKSFRPS